MAINTALENLMGQLSDVNSEIATLRNRVTANELDLITLNQNLEVYQTSCNRFPFRYCDLIQPTQVKVTAQKNKLDGIKKELESKLLTAAEIEARIRTLNEQGQIALRNNPEYLQQVAENEEKEKAAQRKQQIIIITVVCAAIIIITVGIIIYSRWKKKTKKP